MPCVTGIQRQSTFIRDESEKSQDNLETTDSPSRLERQRTFVKKVSVSELAFPGRLVPDFPLVTDFVTTDKKLERPSLDTGNPNEECEDLDSTLDVARSLMAAR